MKNLDLHLKRIERIALVMNLFSIASALVFIGIAVAFWDKPPVSKEIETFARFILAFVAGLGIAGLFSSLISILSTNKLIAVARQTNLKTGSAQILKTLAVSPAVAIVQVAESTYNGAIKASGAMVFVVDSGPIAWSSKPLPGRIEVQTLVDPTTRKVILFVFDDRVQLVWGKLPSLCQLLLQNYPVETKSRKL